MSMFRIQPLSQAVALALAAGTLAVPAAAQQQTPPQPAATTAKPAQIEKVEITGSRIKRVDAETPAPVQVITRDQIERSGALSVTELLRNVPANNAGSFNENAVASFTPGASSISLRGLGPEATLVLINGRRVTPYGFASGGQQTFVDLNSIPIDAIERIDVLLDGASALYGSEAMAGVINIIMRKDFRGLDVTGSFSTSDYHDGNRKRANVTYGVGSLASEGFNLFGAVSYEKRDAVKASRRPNTQDSNFTRLGLADRRSTYAYPGNLYNAANTSFVGPLPGCKPVADGTGLTGRCVYDFTQTQDIQAKGERLTAFLSGVKSLPAGWELFTDFSLTDSRIAQDSPGYNSALYFANSIQLPVGHPQNPTPNVVTIRYRFSDVPSGYTANNETQRIVFGARGTAFDWDLESALLYSSNKTTVQNRGLIRDAALEDYVVLPGTSTARNTWIFGNPAANGAAAIDALYPTLTDFGKTSTTSVDVKASRELFKLGGGNLGIALGADYRREKFKAVPDPLVAAGEISVLGAQGSDGSRNVTAAYLELVAPFLPGWEAQAAVRTDKYSDFGRATTPKFGVKWKPTADLAIRGTYAQGFRAPSLTETSASPVTGFFNNVRDPQLCPDPTDLTNNNCALSIPATIGGPNPNLKPEKSKSFTAGLVWEPVRDNTITFDWYRIKRNNQITFIDPEYLLANEGLYPGLVTRDPATNEILELTLPYSNLGSTMVRGFDITANSRISLDTMGKLLLGLTYNKEATYLVSPVPGAPELNYAGTWSQPKERAQLSIGWDRGVWSTGLTTNYVGSFLRAFTPSDLTCPYTGVRSGLCKVNSWITTDLTVRYTGIANLTIAFGIQNIENKQPPIDERRETRFTVYNSTFHNALGRYYTLNAKYSFK